jgi:2-C-methyl-D-erythritol 4-phosphate cytidylyltransferase
MRTLDRDVLWSIQTPQVFRAAILRDALDTERIADATDDASLVEALGGQVQIVKAPARNFKITWPEDLQRAEALLC